MQLYNGDCLEVLRTLPSGSVDIVLTDPPYNIGKADWDKIPDYIEWCICWMLECQRVLKHNGVLYLWHNDMSQIAELLHEMHARTLFDLTSFCIWDKGRSFRTMAWSNRYPDGDHALRGWFGVTEYCLHFFRAADDMPYRQTGLDRINSNPACYKPIKDWYRQELGRLGLTQKDVAAYYTQATGRKPYMLRHYFCDSQFEIPTREIWERVYEPLGFSRSYEDLRRSYEDLRRSYEDLRRSYEDLRNYHRCDAEHCNVWHEPAPQGQQKRHPCEKPQAILRRLVRVSCKPGGVVLDCFMGSGSTGVAALSEGRDFIGIERDAGYFANAKAWLEEAAK